MRCSDRQVLEMPRESKGRRAIGVESERKSIASMVGPGDDGGVLSGETWRGKLRQGKVKVEREPRVDPDETGGCPWKRFAVSGVGGGRRQNTHPLLLRREHLVRRDELLLMLLVRQLEHGDAMCPVRHLGLSRRLRRVCGMSSAYSVCLGRSTRRYPSPPSQMIESCLRRICCVESLPRQGTAGREEVAEFRGRKASGQAELARGGFDYHRWVIT